MIVEYIRYHIPSDRSDGFLAAYAAAEASLRASSHCLGYDLARCVEDPERYVLRIRWDSLEGHLAGFRKSPEFRSFLQAVQPFVPAIEEMRHYQPTAVEWSR